MPAPILKPPRPKSFTLTEMAVTITVLGVVAAMGTGLVVDTGRACSRSRTYASCFSDAQYALTRMALELRNLATTSNITSMAATSITFNAGGSAVTFSKSGTDLMRGTNKLAANVSSFAIVYFDATGCIATAPDMVARIAISITITRSGNAASARTEIFPRPLRPGYQSWQTE